MPRLCRFARQRGHDAFAVDNQATLTQLRDVAIAQHRSCVQDQRQPALVGEDRRQARQFFDRDNRQQLAVQKASAS